MFILCWSAKGGSGTTVVAATLGLLAARAAPTTLIDLGGDVPAALGVAEPAGPGVFEWLAAPTASGEALLRLGSPVVEGLQLVHRGTVAGRAASDGSNLLAGPDAGGWNRIIEACVDADAHVIIDAGPMHPPDHVHQRADHSLLVTRPCYLALRRASSTGVADVATAAVLVTEPGRALDASDVERALGLAVVAEVPWDPAVARAVDAGLLTARLPAALAKPLRFLVSNEFAA